MYQRNLVAFLYQMNKQNPVSEGFFNSVNEFEKNEKALMIETRIYVGLNDAETKEQKFQTERYKGILKKICQNYHVAFSLDIEEGGYYHDDGEYTEETTLILVMINADRNIVQDIAKDLCTFFHQESVLVTENRVAGYFVKKEEFE